MNFINNLCEKLGKNNKPIYTVMAIATGKGIVRPTLSMTDKKESPDARKYAALRELMTEFIGVPTTFTLGCIGEHMAKFVAKKGTQEFKNAESSLSFLGICMAAGYFVPKFCNIAMPPVMKKLMPNYKVDAPEQHVKQESLHSNPKQKNSTTFAAFNINSIHTGMRV